MYLLPRCGVAHRVDDITDRVNHQLRLLDLGIVRALGRDNVFAAGHEHRLRVLCRVPRFVQRGGKIGWDRMPGVRSNG
jgi:hypothetical protein